MKTTIVWGWALALFVLCSSADSAVAQKRRGARVPGKAIGVGMTIDAGGRIDGDIWRFNGEDDLRGTPGLRIHWDKLLGAKRTRKATVGGSLGVLGRASWWAARDYVDRRSTLIDLALRARFVVNIKSFGLYAGPAFGPTLVSVLNKDYPIDERARPGINLSFVALGFEWWWNPKHALFVELGYQGHWLFHGDFHARMNQALIELGIDFGR